jgi:hypothetical protein
MITIQRKVRLGQRRRVRKVAASAGAPAGRVPRVARLMALAIRFDQLIRDGAVADQAELARVSRVTRARLTQIMNLLTLAPDIQQQILLLPRFERGRCPLTERQLRPISAKLNWSEQRLRFGLLTNPLFFDEGLVTRSEG